MKTRTMLWVLFGGAALAAAWNDAYTAAAVFLCTGVIMQMLHVIEAKLNRLLDHHNIIVKEIDLR